MAASYNFFLVSLSILMAIFASWTTLSLGAKIAQAEPFAARYWLLGGATSMGLGIWSMHFIGMLAYHLPIPIGFDTGLTLLSILPAIIASGIALYFLRSFNTSPNVIYGAAVLMGIGISSMHYTGMAAMRMSPPVQYDPLLFSLSVAIAIVTSWAALELAMRVRDNNITHTFWKKLGSAIIMGCAIAGMHYTGMAAASFAPESVCLAAVSGLSQHTLAILTTAGGFSVLTIAGIASAIDSNLRKRVEHKQLEKSQQALRYKEILLNLSQQKFNTIEEHFKAITEAGCQALNIERSSIWTMYGNTIECLDQFVASIREHQRGMILTLDSTSPYLIAINRQEVILADDARKDPRTCEMKSNWLEPMNIYSMMDVPIWSHGQVVGVLCHEQTGRYRYWNDLEEDFARHLAANVSVAMEADERRRAEQAMNKTTRKYRLLVEQLEAGIIIVQDYVCKFANRAMHNMLGYAQGELVNKHLSEVVAPESQEMVLERFTQRIAGEKPAAVYELFLMKKGTAGKLPAEFRGTLTEYDGKPAVLGTIVNVSERKKTEAALRESEARTRMIVDNALDGVIGIDAAGTITEWNIQAEHILGWSHDEAMGQPLAELIVPQEYRAAHLKGMAHFLATGEGPLLNKRIEVKALHRNGDVIPIELTISPLRIGNAWHFSAFVRDITERQNNEARIRYLAFHDTLTVLPNRALFLDRLEQALHSCRRTSKALAVLFIDLDRFKEINDTLGHAVGDELLRQVASRFQALLREEDTVARLGGDEFVILLPRIGTGRDAAQTASRAIHAITGPFNVLGHELHITTSIGISLFPKDGDDADALLKHADAALYQAKDHGRNCYQFFDSAIDARMHERLLIENDLRHALDRDEFVLHYQPQLDLQSNSIVAVEALLRWQHPRYGLIHPDRFISIAEETGLIEPIGVWVLRRACEQCLEWQKTGYRALRMAVNISARQLRQKNFSGVVNKILNETRLKPEYLELEITESAVMDDVNLSIQVLQELHRMGINLAVDDFGTGYSSLAYLKLLPLHRVKIDKSFVQDIPQDSNDAAIVRAILALANQLKFRVVAEGVEKAEQFDFLQNHGSNEIQGYLICAPESSAVISDFLKTHYRLK